TSAWSKTSPGGHSPPRSRSTQTSSGSSASPQSSRRRTAPNPIGPSRTRHATNRISTIPFASPLAFLKHARMILFGIDRLLAEPELRKPLEGRRVALLAHPASVTRDLTHSLDALAAAGLKLTAAFGPQHGLRGDKQANMVESDDFTDPVHQIPAFSLHGQGPRPTGPP